jgi:hypothetical protein
VPSRLAGFEVMQTLPRGWQRNWSESFCSVFERTAHHFERGTTNRTLALGALWYAGTNAITNSMDYAKFYSRSHDAVIHVFDATVALVETDQPRRHLVGEHVDRAQYRAPFAPRRHRDFHLRI